MKLLLIRSLATTLLALAPLTGCDQTASGTRSAATTGDGGAAPGDGGGADAPGSNRPSYGSPIPFTPGQDLAFIDFMVPQLARGLVMANQVIDRGMRMEVKNFATRVRDEEQAAMDQLKSARTALAGSAESPPAPRDPRAEEVMMQLMTQSGASLEDLYLRSLLGHHGFGMEVILRALPNLENTSVRGLAEHMLESNADEIGEVQQLRHMH
jgi:uncharacterized protein (DUF305 family)